MKTRLINRKHLSQRFIQVSVATLVLLAMVVSSIALAIDDRKPEQIVEETSANVLKTINDENERLREDPTLINQLINDTVIPIIDLDSMGKLILGKYWKRASAEQRTSFVVEFKDMLIRTYAKSLVDYGHAKVNVLPARDQEERKYYTVKTELSVGSGKTPLQVAYIFRKNKQTEWKVFDLAVDGLSLVKNFRTSFNQEIRETSLDALIARLVNTNNSGATDEVAKEVAE